MHSSAVASASINRLTRSAFLQTPLSATPNLSITQRRLCALAERRLTARKSPGITCYPSAGSVVPFLDCRSTHCCPRITGLISPQFPGSSLLRSPLVFLPSLSHPGTLSLSVFRAIYFPVSFSLSFSTSSRLSSTRIRTHRHSHAYSAEIRVSTYASLHKIIYTVNRCSNYERAGASALVQKIAAYFRSIIAAGEPARTSVRSSFSI